MKDYINSVSYFLRFRDIYIQRHSSLAGTFSSTHLSHFLSRKIAADSKQRLSRLVKVFILGWKERMSHVSVRFPR